MRGKATVFITFQMEMFMKVIGIEIYNMEMEFYIMQTEIVIKVNGSMVK